MNTKFKYLQNNIDELKQNNLLNIPKIIDGNVSSTVKIQGKYYLNLCSNDYLGLASSKGLITASASASKKYGIGPAAVRTISGTNTLNTTLEKKLASFKKVEKVMVLQSGFVANIAVIPSVVSDKDAIFSDELNHASIIDGCKLSKAKIIRFKHSDYSDLDKKLASFTKKVSNKSIKKLVITDGVFSMDGDIAPLDKYHQICQKYQALLMVDDAHGEGVLGKNGRGIVDHFGLHGKVDIEVGTMSKAFGVVGGFVAGKSELIDWLKQRARPYLFSSAMTYPDTAACIKAVEIISSSDRLINKLWSNAKYFQKSLVDMGFNIGITQTPITPVMLGDEKLAKVFSNKLFGNGILTTPISYPTVALGKARVRVMISASHTKSQLTGALGVFEKVGKRLKII